MYKPLQKKNSSWTPTTAQKKSKSSSKLGHFSIQPKPNKKSSQSPEIGKYSRDSADRLAANVMRSLEAKGDKETEMPTVQPQSESRISVADVVGQRMPTLTPHTLSPLQRKLTVGQPGDKYEQEADTVAAKVVEQINSPTSQQPVQGKVGPVAQPTVMRDGGVGGGAVDASVEQSIQQAKGGGKGLSEDVREPMEQAFGADFSRVRVHNNSNADQLNRSLNARAFTTGPDIFFKQGEYNPGSRNGQELLAHELTHVVQQTPNLTDDIQQKLGAGNHIQRATGDGHDLSSPRFAKDTTLEDIYDGNGTLKQGDEGDAVRKVQHGIHDAGILFLGHGVDGKFGSETEKRVNSFQRQNKITSDPKGEVGAATIEKLDQLFPAIALPTSATDPYTFAGMLELLCQWNSPMIRDLRTLQVQMVGALEWADEEFDGSNWVPNPMLGAGEAFGSSIIIATNATNEEVARTLYHEYQHARQPVAYRSKDWGDEESRVYEMETYWAIDRGITPDPTLTTTNPVTGEVEVDTTGIESTVESYPGLDSANPGEVIGKVGTNKVRVRMPDGRTTVRNAVAGDSVPGPRRLLPPFHKVKAQEWKC